MDRSFVVSRIWNRATAWYLAASLLSTGVITLADRLTEYRVSEVANHVIVMVLSIALAAASAFVTMAGHSLSHDPIDRRRYLGQLVATVTAFVAANGVIANAFGSVVMVVVLCAIGSVTLFYAMRADIEESVPPLLLVTVACIQVAVITA